MTRTGQNVEIYKGDDRTLEVTIYDAYGNISDLYGASCNWVVYKITQGTIVISKSSPSQITLSSGIAFIPLVPADTENLFPGNYLHEGEITDNYGHVTTAFTGKFTILDSKA